MLTILAKCSHSWLLCLCGNREDPVSLQNKLVSSSFKWVPKYILFLAKLKGEGRPFWNEEGVTLTIIKVFIILFLLEVIRDNLAIFKINQYGFFQLIVQLLPKLKGERKAFFERCKKGGHILWDYSQEYFCHKRWKDLSFCVICNDPTLPMINLWIGSRTYQK